MALAREYGPGHLETLLPEEQALVREDYRARRRQQHDQRQEDRDRHAQLVKLLTRRAHGR